MSFFRNLGSAGFAAPVALGPSARTSDLDVADFDGDGALDAFQTNLPQQPSAPPATLFLNSGSGAFNVLPQVGLFGSYTAAGDLNGDGLADLVMDGQVLFSAGGGSFVAGPRCPRRSWRRPPSWTSTSTATSIWSRPPRP